MKISESKIRRMVNEALLKSMIRELVVEDVNGFDPNDPYNAVELVNDPKVKSGKDWADTEGNFPIKRNGKIYYVSKSATASLAAFCMDKKKGVWCVLANKRGPGAGSNQGLWNLPCGFVERNESAEAGARRETEEETGVKIPANVPLRTLGARSNNNSDRISFAFTCVLPGSIEDYPLSAENSEPGEVADIRWIPILTPGGNVIETFSKSYRWDRNPSDILMRAQTALMPYLNMSTKYDVLVNKLKREISNNPTAMYLLDRILSMSK